MISEFAYEKVEFILSSSLRSQPDTPQSTILQEAERVIQQQSEAFTIREQLNVLKALKYVKGALMLGDKRCQHTFNQEIDYIIRQVERRGVEFLDTPHTI